MDLIYLSPRTQTIAGRCLAVIAETSKYVHPCRIKSPGADREDKHFWPTKFEHMLHSRPAHLANLIRARRHGTHCPRASGLDVEGPGEPGQNISRLPHPGRWTSTRPRLRYYTIMLLCYYASIPSYSIATSVSHYGYRGEGVSKNNSMAVRAHRESNRNKELGQRFPRVALNR